MTQGLTMGVVVNMKEAQAKRAMDARPLPQGGAAVVLFTGVRYERWVEDDGPRSPEQPRARKTSD